MKCEGCGHDYANALTRCTQCGLLNPRRAQRSSESKLIEFPKRPRVPADNAAGEAAVPPWRAELNEKVRAVRARRLSNSAAGAGSDNERLDAGSEATGEAGSVAKREQLTDNERSLIADSRGSAPLRSTTNPIVEAALTRVRRASKNASRASMSMQTTRPLQPTPQTGGRAEREATARALAPTEQTQPLSSPIASPASHHIDQPVGRSVSAGAAVSPAASAPPASSASFDEPLDDAGIVAVADEVEPVDYLAAEISKVDRALSAEFAKNERAPLIAHLLINVVDVLAIAVSAAPFLALIEILNGDFAAPRTQLAAFSVIALISFFYLSLTQFLCGKSFGMMLTNTRIVGTGNYQQPSLLRVLLRTAGYLVGLAPALIGVLWLLLNHRRRGWHDFVSGTIVVRDF